MREFENRLFLVMEGMEQVMSTVDALFDKTVKTAVMVFMIIFCIFLHNKDSSKHKKRNILMEETYE